MQTLLHFGNPNKKTCSIHFDEIFTHITQDASALYVAEGNPQNHSIFDIFQLNR